MTLNNQGSTPLAAAPEGLTDALARLTPSQLTLIESMARAMQVPVDIGGTRSSDIVDDAFAETMANLLTIHHATHEEPLNKKSFEYLFKSCLLAQGLDAGLNPNPGNENWDVRGGEQKWSLKTEAAVGISRNQIKVEKLMEARWVREALTPTDCAYGVSTRVASHLHDYGRIVVLRAFKMADGYEYLLQEIPKASLAEHLKAARPENFSKNGKSISFGADFKDDNGHRLFRVLLDSSVEKVRLWFSADAAVLHGRWRVHGEAAREAHQSSIAS